MARDGDGVLDKLVFSGALIPFALFFTIPVLLVLFFVPNKGFLSWTIIIGFGIPGAWFWQKVYYMWTTKPSVPVKQVKPKAEKKETPTEILKRNFAEGKITEEEYHKKKEILGD